MHSCTSCINGYIITCNSPLSPPPKLKEKEKKKNYRWKEKSEVASCNNRLLFIVWRAIKTLLLSERGRDITYVLYVWPWTKGNPVDSKDSYVGVLSRSADEAEYLECNLMTGNMYIIFFLHFILFFQNWKTKVYFKNFSKS